MVTAVPLQVEGLDLDDERVANLIGELFPDFLWTSVDGLVTMTVYIERGDVTSHVTEVARAVEHHLKGTKVRRVHRDLVNQSDIASRVGVSREAVRKWTRRSGDHPFPAPFDTVGGGDSRASMVWLWSDVVPWLHTVYGIDMDEDLPDDETVAHIDACLAKVKGYLDREWHTVSTPAAAQVPTPSQRVRARSAIEAEFEVKIHGQEASHSVRARRLTSVPSQTAEPVSA